jgi:uncharacterized protein
MQFILIAHDKSGGLPLRMATRPAHLAYWQDKIGPKLLYGGPLLGEDGKPNWSVLVIEAADEAEATGFFEADPYVSVGLFESSSVSAFRTVFRDGVVQA